MKSLITLLTLTGACQLANAALSAQTFTGTIDTININENDVLGPLAVDTIVNGYFTFNDDPGASLGGDIYSATTSISFSDLTLSLIDADTQVSAFDGGSIPGFGFDIFTFAGFGPSSPQTDDMLIIETISLLFSTPDNSAIVSDEVLPYIVDLSLFPTARWELEGINLAGDEFRISGPINSVSLVPEPATYSLLLGTFCLWFAYRNNRDSSRGSP
ncbi:hypothetical protein [Cerasicoccus maritimus]|uniref:hypothetical protein n=1 Tax=Cerasicoccus maritimus TaxID=490089 RepID=UPI002852640F|nr:hypothetical protein [Cerasicoccus maritimus]